MCSVQSNFMASSSHPQVEEFASSTFNSGGSTMPLKELCYDVFINHAKHPLGRVIYEALDAKGLKVFMNSEELEFGDQEVQRAIKSAWLCFPVYSEDYAQSSRCLEELSFISRRKGAKIVPIFCHVKPEDLQSEKEVYAEAFDQYKKEGRHSSEKLREWKEALYIVSHYIGPIVNSKQDEDMLVKNIVDWIVEEGKKLSFVVEEIESANTFSSIQSQVGEFAASTSTSNGFIMTTKELHYDAFINHRGLDVKSTLALAIYKKLKDIGLKVFLDTEVLRWGDHLPSVLEKATKSASKHIAIFSKNYAQSQWCLRELSLMLQISTRIIPIFYYVKPQDLRSTKGEYANAFEQYKNEGKYTLKMLQEWKEALSKVSYIIGLIINNKEDEDMMLRNIVDFVTKEEMRT